MAKRFSPNSEGKKYHLTISVDNTAALRFLAACDFCRDVLEKDSILQKTFYASVYVQDFIIKENKKFEARFRSKGVEKQFEDFLRASIQAGKKRRKDEDFI